MNPTLVSRLACLVGAVHNCDKSGNLFWRDRHTRLVLALVDRYLPSGSGFDAGTKLDLDRSTADRLVFTTAFHHMNEAGYYTGWTHHDAIVTPCFDGISIRFTGRNLNAIKSYNDEAFHDILIRRISNTEITAWYSADEDKMGAA